MPDERPSIDVTDRLVVPQPAGFFLRVMAFGLDVTVVAPVLAVVVLLHDSLSTSGPLTLDAAVLCFHGLRAFYCGILESSPFQATLGKRLVDVRVADLFGSRLSFPRAVGRGLLGFFLLPISVLFSRYRRGWHDLLFGATVVHRNRVFVFDPASDAAPSRHQHAWHLSVPLSCHLGGQVHLCWPCRLVRRTLGSSAAPMAPAYYSWSTDSVAELVDIPAGSVS